MNKIRRKHAREESDSKQLDSQKLADHEITIQAKHDDANIIKKEKCKEYIF
jgi:hypothetical protein